MSIEKLSIDGDIIGTDAEHVEYGKNNAATVEDALDALFNGAGGGSTPTPSGDIISAGGSWLSIGTSITWHDTATSGYSITHGYQTQVRKRIQFTNYVNRGVSGATISDGIAEVSGASITPDFVTVEFGVNDMSAICKRVVGTMSDYINDTYTNNGTKSFYGYYRAVINAIREKNQYAKIILCTPTKFIGGAWGLPAHWDDELNVTWTEDGTAMSSKRKLQDFADAITEIAKYESFPLCDWFNESGMNTANLLLYTRDATDNPSQAAGKALHPNDAGYNMMAAVLVETFKKAIPVN